LRDGWTYVALCGDPDVDRRGLGVEALGVFLEYLFTMWNFHKVYFEIPAFNFKRLAPSISDYFTQEGTLHDHLFYGGRSWDMYIYSVTRTRWSYLARSNDVVQFGLGRRRHDGEHDEGTLGIDAFVSLVAKSLEIDSPMTPDATWEELGVDSLGMVELEALFDEMTGNTVISTELHTNSTLRDAYLRYCEATSLPRT
jgi:acyl carrier protein